jgi:hypothetical protein
MLESLETKVSQVIAELSEVRATSEIRAIQIKEHITEKEGLEIRLKKLSNIVEDL